MKFLKIKLKNFRPYYEKQGKTPEIDLFDESKNQNITLTIGQNGYGKTSISEAILWCIFGDQAAKYGSGQYLNTLYKRIAKEKNENTVNFSVELLLELGGKHYRLIRMGDYDLRNDQKIGQSKLSILHEGVFIDQVAFVDKYFPSADLMKYFVFDADDILTKFESNRAGTIEEHINNFAGINRLDNLIKLLKYVLELYDAEKRNKESEIHGPIPDHIKTLNTSLFDKREAIAHLKEDIKKREEEKTNLFRSGSPDMVVKNFSELIDRRKDLQEYIRGLNEKFKNSQIISIVDLLFLDVIIADAITKLDKKHTTKDEFYDSIEVIKSSLGGDYVGILFNEKETDNLIRKGSRIWDQDLDDMNKLLLESGEGTKSLAIKTFRKNQSKIERNKGDFKKFRQDLAEKMEELSDVSHSIRKIGETSENKDLKRKYERFVEIEKEIKERETNKTEIEEKVEEILLDIKEKEKELALDDKTREDIKKIEIRKEHVDTLLTICIKSKEEYLRDLLLNVNKNASEFLRNTVKEPDRLNAIEIDSNYKFVVKQNDGSVLDERLISKSNLQIAMMSFFLGLSKFLEKKIPYVIDNPLIRFDPGNDKRFIESLSKTNEQLILHLIPVKEYSEISFNWLKPNLNIQNWLEREKYGGYGGLESISYAERKDTNKIVYFDINRF